MNGRNDELEFLESVVDFLIDYEANFNASGLTPEMTALLDRVREKITKIKIEN